MYHDDKLDLKELFTDLSKATICGVKIGDGNLAPLLAGHVMKHLNRAVSVKDIKIYVEALLKQPIELARPEDIKLLEAMGLIQRPKLEPHHRLTKSGRNDPCPCGSGSKYKNCCISLVKAYERNQLGPKA